MLSQLVIINTLRCNFKCAHCIRGYPEERSDFPMELLPKLLMEARPFGAKHVALTGGEPFLHPQFTEMVETIVSAGYTWHFVSNGWETKAYLPLLEKHGESVSHVALSLDGATPEIHDAIRGRSGSFERVMQATKVYGEMGISILWNVCLNNQNMHQLEDIIQLAEKFEISMMNIMGTNPTPWNTDLVLTDDESQALSDQVLALRDESKVKIATRSSLRAGSGINFCRQLWLRELSINTNGEIIVSVQGGGNKTLSLLKCSIKKRMV
ncbi:MAG: radical SAM protein [Anaerolineae bacterium]|nr:radical SAM protein [Anaerolineae bacterium]